MKVESYTDHLMNQIIDNARLTIQPRITVTAPIDRRVITFANGETYVFRSVDVFKPDIRGYPTPYLLEHF